LCVISILDNEDALATMAVELMEKKSQFTAMPLKRIFPAGFPKKMV
jgi:hypothetical protein